MERLRNGQVEAPAGTKPTVVTTACDDHTHISYKCESISGRKKKKKKKKKKKTTTLGAKYTEIKSSRWSVSMNRKIQAIHSGSINAPQPQ
jgi:hypothetical protein